MKEFKSTDLYESSFLYASGQNLLRLEGESQQRWFVFDNREQCERLSNTYWSKKAVVNAKEYADSIRTLKDRLFARR